jgi:hypothetical protein
MVEATKGLLSIIDLQILFWKVTSRIVRGVNSVGGCSEVAVPAGGV